jgi:1,4-dihydroxy-6-naphthoate synthase
MQLEIAISPCPNDTFIFENLFNKTIAIEGISFNFHFLDIEQLNNAATLAQYDIIKISYAHLHTVSENYALLQSGGAMGYGVGPLLVKDAKMGEVDIAECLVALPGKNTTANFLLTYLYPQILEKQKKYLLFSDIENAVLENECQLGVLIHEGRFSYKEHGLALINDLGDLWQKQENLPIPLGCIVAKHSLGERVHQQLEQAIADSISNYDMNGVPIISDFVKQHAQEMSEQVMLQHITLYVNAFSKSIGTQGLQAISKIDAIRGSAKFTAQDK